MGYDSPRVSQEIPARLKEWLSVDRVDRATLRAMPVVFVNLGTVDESVDVEGIEMLIKAFGDLPTIWSLSSQQADYFSGKDLPESVLKPHHTCPDCVYCDHTHAYCACLCLHVIVLSSDRARV